MIPAHAFFKKPNPKCIDCGKVMEGFEAMSVSGIDPIRCWDCIEK